MTKDKRKFLCIVGAGFSHALNSKMPLCSGVLESFINRVLDRKDKTTLSGWDVIAYLACYGFLGEDAKIKMAGCDLISNFRLYDSYNSPVLDNYLLNYTDFKNTPHAQDYKNIVSNKNFTSERTKVIKDLYLDKNIKNLATLLRESHDRYKNINIEELLKREQALGYHDSSEAIGPSFDQIFFREFQHTVLEEKTADHFRIFISDLEKHFDLSFLSFNYDIMLESILAVTKRFDTVERKDILDKGRWNEFSGYGIPFDFAINASAAKAASEQYWDPSGSRLPNMPLTPILHTDQSPYKIYKPHGSINWLADDETAEMVLIIKDNPDDIFDVRGGQFGCKDTATDKERDLTTILLPPLPTKSSSMPKLWSQNKDIKKELEEADVIMVIGWSCPESDQNWCRQLESIFQNRSKQLDCLIVVNPDRHIYTRLNALMQPKCGHDIADFRNRNLSAELLPQIIGPYFFGTVRHS